MSNASNAPEQLPPYRCEECLRGPAKTDFLRDAEGRPSALCIECQARKAAKRQLAKHDQLRQRDVTKLLRMAVRQRVNLPPLSEAVSKLVGRFGGMDTIVDIIYVKLDHMLSMDDDLCSPKVTLDALKFLVGFIRAGMAEVQTTIDASALSDEELDQAMRAYLLEVFGPSMTAPAETPERQLTCEP